MWGASVLERPFDRMSGFDAATTGASQQVHKSYLRYFKVDKYRDILGGVGGPQALKGLQEMIMNMRMFASNEGITVIDSKDDMVTAQASTFTVRNCDVGKTQRPKHSAYDRPEERLGCTWTCDPCE